MTKVLCFLLFPLMFQGSISIPSTKSTGVNRCSYSEVVNDSEHGLALQAGQANPDNASSEELQSVAKRIKHAAGSSSSFLLTDKDVTESTNSKNIMNQNGDYFVFLV